MKTFKLTSRRSSMPKQIASARVGKSVQAQIRLGSTSDPLEREADRVAAQVTTGKFSLDPTRVALRASGGAGVQNLPSGFEGRLNSLSSGQPLGASVRGKFEGRMGRDFSQVRVHTGQQAAGLAQSINANAFAHGNDIVFGPGRYAPESREGQCLLAHELTHTVQQSDIVQRETYCSGEYGVCEEEVTVVLELQSGGGTFFKVVTISDYGDLADAYQALNDLYSSNQYELVPDLLESDWDGALMEYGWDLNDLRDTYRSWDEASTVDLTDEAIEQLVEHALQFQDLIDAAYDAYLEKQKEFLERIRNAKADARTVEDNARDAIRAQFLNGGEGDDTTSFLWAMADGAASTLGTLASAAENPYCRLSGAVLPGVLSLANVALNWADSNPGTSVTTLVHMTNLSSVVSAAAGVAGTPLIIVTAHIGPLLSAISGAMDKVASEVRKENDDWTYLLGIPLKVEFEPGGEDMWNYMVEVMRAGLASDIPLPTGDALTYFEDYQEEIDGFVEKHYYGQLHLWRTGLLDQEPVEHSAIPIEGVSFNAAFPLWIFDRRTLIWTMLYGSRDASNALRTDE